MAPPEGKNDTAKGAAAPAAPKIVGPNITGKQEEYRLERRLQSGLFGGVYEAKGLSSGRLYAVKVLHRSELQKAQRASSLEFCEVPLSEVKYGDLMRGHEHVMQVEDHFEDQYCHYIVFELARGGDLLEALKLKPNGFEESQAQFLIGQAARGLACLHDRHLAMQDVSLENMLMHVLDNGQFQVKICDPGQAVLFGVDAETGERNLSVFTAMWVSLFAHLRSIRSSRTCRQRLMLGASAGARSTCSQRSPSFSAQTLNRRIQIGSFLSNPSLPHFSGRRRRAAHSSASISS